MALSTRVPDVMPVSERRYHGLDALRGSMMLLGILLHGAVFYLSAPPASMPMQGDQGGALVFDLLFHFIHSFRVPAFFVLAGFFAALLVEKRGVAGALRNRGARVLLPLLAAAVTLLPLSFLLMLNLMLSLRFGSHSIWPDLDQLRILSRELRAAGVPVDQHALGYLWFLYYLCMFYLLIPLLEPLLHPSGRLRRGLDRLPTSPWSLLPLGLISAITLWPFHGGQVHEGFMFLTPHVPSLLYYGTFFVFGYLLRLHRHWLEAFSRHAILCLVLGLALFPLSLFLTQLDVSVEPTRPLFHLAAALGHGLCTWALIVACIGGAQRWFDADSAWTRYVSRSSYWVFLLHMPVISFAAWALVPFVMPLAIKFIAITVFTTVVCFLTYHHLVQNSWIGRALNGRRWTQPWPWRATPAGD